MRGAVFKARRHIGWALCGTIAALLPVSSAPAQLLPETMPAPPLRADERQADEPDAPADKIPLPSSRPDTDTAAKPNALTVPDKPAPMPAEEVACRIDLRALGVDFEERESLSSNTGCRVDHPIAITPLGNGVDIEPEAVLNCATARAAAEFVADVVAPQTQATFGSSLTSIHHASAYVCRTRRDQADMSEHAFGNALDFSSFELKDGTVIEVKAYGPGELARRDFIRQLRASACGPFTTVLGPGADADHAVHLHFDLKPRRRGGTYCK